MIFKLLICDHQYIAQHPFIGLAFVQLINYANNQSFNQSICYENLLCSRVILCQKIDSGQICQLLAKFQIVLHYFGAPFIPSRPLNGEFNIIDHRHSHQIDCCCLSIDSEIIAKSTPKSSATEIICQEKLFFRLSKAELEMSELSNGLEGS